MSEEAEQCPSCKGRKFHKISQGEGSMNFPCGWCWGTGKRPSEFPSTDLLAEFDALLLDYGNSVFDCGEHEGTCDEYDQMLLKSRAAKTNIREWVKKNCANSQLSGDSPDQRPVKHR